jgi:hypothetical protein
MNCEGCSLDSETVSKFHLWNYCVHCGANLCPACMAKPCRQREINDCVVSAPQIPHEPADED